MHKLRFLALFFLFVHHVFTFFHLAKVGKVMLEDENIIKQLAPFRKLGPRFLTNWNFFNQLIYIIIELVVIIYPFLVFKADEGFLTKVKKSSQLLFWSIVFPWTFFIPSLFWPVYNYDRELIFPKAIDHIMPLWVNHSVHTVILLLIIVEVALNTQRPPRWKTVMKYLTIYALFYVSVMVFTYFNNNIWLYGFLKLLNWPERITFFLTTYFLLSLGTWVAFQYKNNEYNNLNKVKC